MAGKRPLIVMKVVTDPAEPGRARARRERFDRNAALRAFLALAAAIVWVHGAANAPAASEMLPAGSAAETRLLRLAHAAVGAEVRGQAPPSLAGGAPARPVFVTLERRGCIRGCRGALTVRARSLEEEVALAARAAAAHDPRYRPLRPHELVDLQVTVTVIDALRPLGELSSLPPSEGLVLRAGSRTGVVLPWEGKDPATRLRWAYRKASVPIGAPCRLFRLIGERFRG